MTLLFIPAGQTFLTHRWGGGQTFCTRGGGQAFSAGSGSGDNDIDGEEEDVSKASKLSTAL